MRKLSTHAEWLRLVEVSGPFISTTMLERTFPQGLESIDTPRRQRLRSAYEEWRDAVDENDPQLAELHREWVRLVLEDILDYDRRVLVGREDFGSDYVCRASECAVTFVPDLAVIAAGDEHPRLFISIQPPDMDLEKVQVNDGWPVPLVERMTLLCRTAGVRLGIVTNGERWMLVNAPVGSTSSHISWYSRLWFQEPVTLKAFLSLLGARRCFGPEKETLDALQEESLKHHEEVSDTLGEQVRRAVEELVQCLDKADLDRNRELLHDVSPAELYEAGLTIMMRLVFVLCAEERGLLLLDDPVYDQYYAISTLRGQLAEDADRHGPEVLERRHDAWTRLLAVFRSIYGGINHESLRMPALGGSLFDPDRFPFLEGRAKGTKWHETKAAPLPIDNRTVLLLLEALQLLEQTGGALLLSYKALDVENIGHVYEGLLEHTVARVPEVTLGIIGSHKVKNPNISLRELEMALATDEKALTDVLLKKTLRSEAAIRNALAKPVDETLSERILTVCGGDTNLTQRVSSFANLLRTDAWGDPIIYLAHSFMVTIGADRSETGTHYTPKVLTEMIVSNTLEPIAFFGPAEGKPREEWRLKSPDELLNLKICDIAMGSGAFLVQSCRWLAEHLVEAWINVESRGDYVTIDGEIVACLNGKEPMFTNMDDRLLMARRLVAERCLYGVDLNPIAVELSKLSIWLITMAKGRPFGFLDHNMRCGDSLLGIHRLDQLAELSMTSGQDNNQIRLFGRNIEKAVNKASELRQQLRKMPIRDIYDVEAMARLNETARRQLEVPERIADAFIGEVFNAGGNRAALESATSSLAIRAGQAVDGNNDSLDAIIARAKQLLSTDLSSGGKPRKPFHWPLEFPEVFVSEKKGFDAILGNPPYLGGRKIRSNLGINYLRFLTNCLYPKVSANADLCAFFLRRCALLSKIEATNGFVTTSSISEGDTREFGLDNLLYSGWSIFMAKSKFVWPGTANVTVSPICTYFGSWKGLHYLNNEEVCGISSYLTESSVNETNPLRLQANYELSFQGSIPLGKGFVIPTEKVHELLNVSPKYQDVIYPYLVGQELNIDPMHEPSKWIINFHDWPLDRETAAPEYSGPVAADYPLCLEIVRELVYPERTRTKENGEFVLRKPLPQKWWIYGDKRPELYSRLSKLEWALAIATQATKYVAFGKVTGKRIFSHAIAIIASDDYSIAAILSSSLHEIWARRYGSYNLLLLRYSPSDLFDTFPLPPLTERLRETGKNYYEARTNTMLSNNDGLTNFYNKVHNPQETNHEFIDFRERQKELDCLVTQTYGWGDIDLGHGFHEVPYLPGNDKIRFTISESARLEILRRLLDLNGQNAEKEAVLKLQNMPNSKASRRVVTISCPKSSSQPGLGFDSPSAEIHAKV